MARGMPSRRRQISAIALAFSAVREKPAETSRARSMKSWTDSARSMMSGGAAVDGNESAGTGHARSPRTPSASREVARTVMPRQARSSASMTRATSSMMCSQLSRTSSADRLRSSSTSSAGSGPISSRIPNDSAITLVRSPASVRLASSTIATGCSDERGSDRSSSHAMRVLPLPPAPVSVSSRPLRSRSTSSAISVLRPTKCVMSSGIEELMSLLGNAL